MARFFIGQRVLYNNEIVITINPPYTTSRPNDETTQWVRLESSVPQWCAVENLKPLPNGQL